MRRWQQALWEFLEEANNWLVGMFGTGFLGIFGLILRQLYKIYKEKREENRLNKIAFKRVIDNDAKQDKRISKLEKHNLDIVEPRGQNLVDAQIAGLHNQIWTKSERYITRGYLNFGELDNFEMMYHAYKNLGENHTGDTLYKKVKILDIKKEGILREDEI